MDFSFLIFLAGMVAIMWLLLIRPQRRRQAAQSEMISNLAVGDEIVTAGSQRGNLHSLYPRGIPIGKVTSVGQSDTDVYKRIQVDPYVDFGSLHSVVVIVPKQPVELP